MNRNDALVQTAARNIFVGVAPERSEELQVLWEKYCPCFNVLPDISGAGKFVFDAGAYRDVRFNHRAMRAFWVSSFAAWEAYTALALSVQRGVSADLARLNRFLDAIQKILHADDPESVPLPSGVPEPGTLVDASVNAEARAAGELAIFAVGWALLHEVRHIQHQREGTSAEKTNANPEHRHHEEFSCDEFATAFILEGVDSYAEQHNVEASLVRQKRQLGIHFALFSLVLVGKDKWGMSDSHPSLQERINATSRCCCGDGSDEASAIAHLAYLSLKQLWPSTPGLFAFANSS